MEAAPDSLPQASFSLGSARPGVSRAGGQEEVEEVRPQFYRGNIETGGQRSLLYYGAAKTFNSPEEEILSTGEVYQPLRQAVEARPEVEDGEIQDMEDLRDHFQSQHGQTFHQARQAGHSRTHGKYQTYTNTGTRLTGWGFARGLIILILFFLHPVLFLFIYIKQ